MERHRQRVVIFILLSLLVFILLICTITSLENLSGHVSFALTQIQKRIKSSFEPTETLQLPELYNNTYCAHLAQKPTAEEVKEERDLLNSIAWPGPLQDLPIEYSSSPDKSYYVIQNQTVLQVAGQLVVNVHVRNFLGLPKKHGGDFLIARLHSPNLGAGVTGKVHDHLDGNYTVVFPLLWAGEVQVLITMVHPSEAIIVLKKVQEKHPDRVYFKSQFRSGTLSETTECNLCLPHNHQPLCDYTDPETREPWYCYKPKSLGCDTRLNHFKGGYRSNIISKKEQEFFRSEVNLKVPIPASKTQTLVVLPAEKEQVNIDYNASGYYYQNGWTSLNGIVIQQYENTTAITQCLRGKLVYMFGDSTVRQWFEYLSRFVPEFDIHNNKQAGPLIALDSKNNIFIQFRLHGPPLRSSPMFVSKLRYVANELDTIQGGPDTVVVLGVWAHYNTFPIEVYIRRLRHIRRAVARLLDREPATLVVIRSANLQHVTPGNFVFNSDWFSLQNDVVLRAMFRGLNVLILDAWEMTVAHSAIHNIHPPVTIIRNMINFLLSHICSSEKSMQ